MDTTEERDNSVFQLINCIGGKTVFTNMLLDNLTDSTLFNEVICNFPECLDWDRISPIITIDRFECMNMTYVNYNLFLCTYSDYINWDLFSRESTFRIETVKVFEDKINFKELSCNKQSLNDDVVEAYKDKLDWDKISNSLLYDKEEYFLRKYQDYIKWDKINTSLLFAEENLLEEFGDRMGWDKMLEHNSIFLNYEFADRNFDKFTDKNCILTCIRYLPSDFLEKYYAYFDKKIMAKHVFLSWKFIKRHINDFPYEMIKDSNMYDSSVLDLIYN